mmetsp:Transcript_62237/g.110962  ORF Transcript_62237/g.110962 Transcript_62237/m.110962 type:complete len:265 (+) Transcript_62237:1180-1974(+)
MRFCIKWTYFRVGFKPPSTITRLVRPAISAQPVSLYCVALVLTLNFFGLLLRSPTLKIVTIGSALASFSILACCLAFRSSGVSFRSWFRASCALRRASISARTNFSIAVGSCVASVPSTRIRLLTLTLGFGGSIRPSLTCSCFSFSRAIRPCVRIFFRSAFVSMSGRGPRVTSLFGPAWGTGWSTRFESSFGLRFDRSSATSTYFLSVMSLASSLSSHHSICTSSSRSSVLSTSSSTAFFFPRGTKLGFTSVSLDAKASSCFCL